MDRGRWLLVGGLGAVVAVLAVLLVVQQRGDEAATDVFVIGDSIEVMAGGKDLGKEGWTVDAVSGRTTAQGIEVAEAHDLSDVPVVMVALGTNDYRADAESYGRLVDRMLEAIGPGPMVIWINIDTNTPALAGAKTGVNAALTAAAARHPNLRVADWDTYIRDVPDEGGLRAGDGIHYGLKGSQVRRDWMRGLVGPMG